MNPTPILFLSDSPSACTGLGRICRDLAWRLHQHCSDIFRVGTFGYGGFGSRSLPFQQYFIEGMNDWFIPTLPDIWEDFAGNEKGVIFTIWDASRLLWFARPEMGTCPDPRIRKWLEDAPFERWGYFPIDAEGPHHKLSIMLGQCITGYDRVLAYSNWAMKLIENTLGKEESAKRHLNFLPHGIDTSVFRPGNRAVSRLVFPKTLRFQGREIRREEVVIGIVATNQARKDYGLAISAIAEASQTLPIRLFVQIDILERYWSIPALVVDYGLQDRTIVNCGQVPDELMASIYSACDLTLGIGSGEGFGYPIFESLACGTPVITGSYGGQAEWMDPKMLMRPEHIRLEGIYNCVRPVFGRHQWSQAIIKTVAAMRNMAKANPFAGQKSLLPLEIDWENNWVKWEAWFRKAHRISIQRQGSSPDQPSSTPEMDTEQSDLRSRSVASQESPSDPPEPPASEPPCPESV